MDKHLNFFRFFNGAEYEFWEDNLSRAFAICLKNDTTLLTSVLKTIMKDDYSMIFNNEYLNAIIDIDLQRKVKELENYTYIYAVACSGSKIDEVNIENEKSRDTDNPETDLLISVGDICMIFEFKQTDEDCSSQLKRQAELIKENSPDCEKIIYINYDWHEIVKTSLFVLSFERQLKNENIFLKNFIDFVEDYNKSWFPEKMLSSIAFPVNESEKQNKHYLNQRLNSIKEYVFGKDKTKLIGDRYIIVIDKKWAKELHIDYLELEDEKFISVEVYPGDTKWQGVGYFKENKNYNWNNEKICGYGISVSYYLKFSHFNSGITWLELSNEESKKTHNYKFFSEWSGRYNEKRSKNWKSEFVEKLDKIIPNWKVRTDWDDVIANSNRNYFDLSVGTHLRVLIPYSDAQKMDDTNDEKNKLAGKIREIFEELSAKIDK